MRPTRITAPLTRVMAIAALLAVTLTGAAAQEATPAATPGATPGATPLATPLVLGAAECTVDPIDPVSYGEAVRAATSVTDPPAYETGRPADPATTEAVSAVIRISIACTESGDMSRILAVTDPAFAPAMLGVQRADVQPEIDRAVAEAPPAGVAGPPLIEESDGREVHSTLLGIDGVVTFPDGTAAIRLRLDSPQNGGVAAATAWLRLTDTGWKVTTWALVR